MILEVWVANEGSSLAPGVDNPVMIPSSAHASTMFLWIDADRIHMARRSWYKRKGKYFVAGGWGKFGPYLTVTKRIGRRTYAKASIGALGPLVGVKHTRPRVSAQAMMNLSTGKPSFSFKARRRRKKR
ncbi:MAG: hypothetical protein ACTSPE_00325 [Candidatus Thorarchaeota archaeon]